MTESTGMNLKTTNQETDKKQKIESEEERQRGGTEVGRDRERIGRGIKGVRLERDKEI